MTTDAAVLAAALHWWRESTPGASTLSAAPKLNLPPRHPHLRPRRRRLALLCRSLHRLLLLRHHPPPSDALFFARHATRRYVSVPLSPISSTSSICRPYHWLPSAPTLPMDLREIINPNKNIDAAGRLFASCSSRQPPTSSTQHPQPRRRDAQSVQGVELASHRPIKPWEASVILQLRKSTVQSAKHCLLVVLEAHPECAGGTYV